MLLILALQWQRGGSQSLRLTWYVWWNPASETIKEKKVDISSYTLWGFFFLWNLSLCFILFLFKESEYLSACPSLYHKHADVPRGQKTVFECPRTTESSGHELPFSTGNWTPDFCKSIKYSYLWSHLYSPSLNIFKCLLVHNMYAHVCVYHCCYVYTCGGQRIILDIGLYLQPPWNRIPSCLWLYTLG